MGLSTVMRVALMACVPSVLAIQTSIGDDLMTDLFNQGGVGLAMRSAPIWFFSQALRHPPCYPTKSFQDGRQTRPAAVCPWPDTGCNCRKPGVPTAHQGPDFPIYFTYKRCAADKVRIAYNLFYEKDGFSPDRGNGHG